MNYSDERQGRSLEIRKLGTSCPEDSDEQNGVIETEKSG